MRLARLLAPHRRRLALAFAAMLVESGAELLEPWPLKIVFDHVLGSKPLPGWAPTWLATSDRWVVLNAAALAVLVIAAVGAASSYAEKHLSTTVGAHVAYDLRRLLYHHA